MGDIELKLSPDFELKSLYQLHLPVTEVSEDFTLYDLFCIINDMEQTYPGLAAIFGMPCFDKFWEQICLDREEDDNDDVEYLELHWGVDYDTRVIPMTSKEKAEWQKHHSYPNCALRGDNNYWDDIKRGELSDLMGFDGIGDYSEEDIKRWPNLADSKCGYAIEFTPVNNLKHLPIKLNNEVSFYQPFVTEGTELCRTGFLLKRDPSLWTIITSVFWELTFCGFTPIEVAEKSSDLQKACQEAKAVMNKLDQLSPEEKENMTDDELEQFLEDEEQKDGPNQ